MCNIRCPFCYYNEELNQQQYRFQEVIEMLDTAWELGIRDIDFSGGEPTMRKDFVDMIAYAKDKGFEHICVITNGTRIANLEYLRSLLDAGLNEILLSVHAANEPVSNLLSGRNNVFEKVINALENASALGVRIRTNTVVNQENQKSLPQIADIIKHYEIAAHNFICFNDWVNASPVTAKMAVKFSEVAGDIRQCVETLSENVSKVTVRYIPYCFMQGMEQHVCNLRQNLYDNDEWNDSVKRVVTDIDKPEKIVHYKNKLNTVYSNHKRDIHEQISRYGLATRYQASLDNSFDELRIDNIIPAHIVENYALLKDDYVKNSACSQCSRNNICDGVHKSYGSFIGTDELKPIAGDVLNDPMQFRGKYSANWR